MVDNIIIVWLCHKGGSTAQIGVIQLLGHLLTDCAGCCNAGEESEIKRLRLQLRHVEGELAAARGQAAGVDVNLAHVDDVIALKTQVANLMAELESERHAAREVGAQFL